MKRKLTSLLLVLSLFLTLASIPALAEEKVELNFWYWDVVMDETYTEMFEAFSSENPNITVKMTRIPWADYWTKLQTALPTGAGPDIFWLNHPNAVTYLPTGLIASIQSLIDSGAVGIDHFAASMVDPYVHEGATYGVPVFFDTIGFAYNKQLLADAGYPDGPPADWTWEDLREIATKLTTDDVYGYVVSNEDQASIMPFLLQNGGGIYSEDGTTSIIADDNNVETIQFMLDLINVDKVSPTVTEQKELNMDDLFQNEMAAMVNMGLWRVAPYYEALGDNLGIAPLPKHTQQGSVVHNLAYVMSNKMDEAKVGAAETLMTYLASKDHGDRIAKVFAPAYDESQVLWFENFPTLDLKVFTDALEYSKGLMISSKNAGPTYSLFAQEIDKLLQMDNPDVKTELTRIQEVLNAEINK